MVVSPQLALPLRKLHFDHHNSGRTGPTHSAQRDEVMRPDISGVWGSGWATGFGDQGFGGFGGFRVWTLVTQLRSLGKVIQLRCGTATIEDYMGPVYGLRVLYEVQEFRLSQLGL